VTAPGFVQVATDGSGKRVDNVAVTLPSGTVVTNADGTTTTLTADTVVYRQGVHLVDPDDVNARQNIGGENGRGAAGTHDRSVVLALQEMHGTLKELLDELREFVHS
jgi:GTPase involved in cell partitioning and DNA repair